MIQRVAVYGTLKRGGSNSKLLKGTIFLGEDWLTGVTLYDLGPYPGALAEPSKGVKVEVFEVNDQTLEQLDRLEDFFPEAPAESLYLRREIPTQFGLAWVYIYNRPVANHRRIASGNW